METNLEFWPTTRHPMLIPLLIGSALIVSTDDHTLTDMLVVVTDISLYCLMESLSELSPTAHNSLFPVPTQLNLTKT